MTLDVITGAFGYTGRYIAQRLLDQGHRVKTLTGHPGRLNPFGDQIQVAPFNFNRPRELAASLEGCRCIFNTYWIRFKYKDRDFEQAVVNSRLLIQAARDAGVRRFVHVSITNASAASPLPYFRGKGLVEQALIGSGLSYAILRPTILFGPGDILINNIAWLLRRFPLFAIPGDGEYRVQPIFVDDFARITVEAAQSENSVILDVVGPETHSFNELVGLLANIVGSRAAIVRISPRLALLAAQALGLVVGDVLLTADEVKGLMANLLISDQTPLGQKLLTEWLAENVSLVGTSYSSEIARHYR